MIGSPSERLSQFCNLDFRTVNRHILSCDVTTIDHLSFSAQSLDLV
jgi:hypothetical protein